jgi:hypothetical protein
MVTEDRDALEVALKSVHNSRMGPGGIRRTWLSGTWCLD